MKLSTKLVNDFVRATYDKPQKVLDETVYGVYNKGLVIFDGTDSPTPCRIGCTVNDGDRVIVRVQNHTATITGVLKTYIPESEVE